MKRLCALLLLPALAFAVPSPIEITVDSAGTTAPSIQLYRSSPRTIRARFVNATPAEDLTGLTTNDLHMTISTGTTSTAYIASDATIYNATNGQVDFSFTAGDLNISPGTYLYEVAAGASIVRQGWAILTGSPFSTGTNNPNWYTNQDLAGWTFSNYPWLTDAPSDASIYGRRSNAWEAINLAAGSGLTTNIKVGTTSSPLLVVSNGATAQATLVLSSLVATTGQWAADVAVASLAATNADIKAALALANNVLASNAIPSIAGLATTAQLGAASNALNAGILAVGLVASNASSPSLMALSNSVTAVGLVASNALAGLPSLAAISNALITAVGVTNQPAGVPYLVGNTLLVGTNDTAGSGGATGTPLYVESDPFWSAVSNLFQIGTNILSDQSGTNLAYNGVGLRDGVGAGGGGGTQGIESVLSINNTVDVFAVESPVLTFGSNSVAYGASNVIVLGGGYYTPDIADSRNTVSNSASSAILGGSGNVIFAPAGNTRQNFIIGGNGSDILYNETAADQLIYNGIFLGNNHHIRGGQFNFQIGGGGITVSNADLTIGLNASHGSVIGLPGSHTAHLLYWGPVGVITGQVSRSVVFGCEDAATTANGQKSFTFGQSTLWQMMQGTNPVCLIATNKFLSGPMATNAGTVGQTLLHGGGDYAYWASPGGGDGVNWSGYAATQTVNGGSFPATNMHGLDAGVGTVFTNWGSNTAGEIDPASGMGFFGRGNQLAFTATSNNAAGVLAWGTVNRIGYSGSGVDVHGSAVGGSSNQLFGSDALTIGKNNSGTSAGDNSFVNGEWNNNQNVDSIVSGYGNTNLAAYSFVGGNNSRTPGGGYMNWAWGDYATAGAAGSVDSCVAIGPRAQANHNGAMVLVAGRQGALFANTAPVGSGGTNQMVLWASGGVAIGQTNYAPSVKLAVNGPMQMTQGGTGQFTSGLCVITFPFAQVSTNYHVLVTPIGASLGLAVSQDSLGTNTCRVSTTVTSGDPFSYIIIQH